MATTCCHQVYIRYATCAIAFNTQRGPAKQRLASPWHREGEGPEQVNCLSENTELVMSASVRVQTQGFPASQPVCALPSV